MAYLTGFGDDIFVTYAHVDDEIVSDAGHGWVTEVVKCLKAELARKLGRSDAYAMWVDHELLHSHPVTPQILDRVRQSAILVVILSPGYIASDWCRREREAFFNAMRETGARNVFVVETDEIDEADRPQELADFSPIRFWSKGPRGGAARVFGWPRPQLNDYEYYGVIKDLAQAIADEMRRLKRQEANGTPVVVPDQPTKPTVAPTPEPVTGRNGCVYLAQVTDDLDNERNNVRRFLEQADIRVVPTGMYSQEPSAFRAAATADIANAQLFVQLLSGIAGKRPPDLPEGYIQCQLQIALDANRPVLQWHSPRLDVQSVEDDGLRAILQGQTVNAEPIEDFKQEIQRRLKQIREPPPKIRSDAFIFVDMDSTDRPLAEELCKILDRYGAGYILPPETEDPGDYREELEGNLSYCDVLMVIYGASTTNWVRNHLRECHKALVTRERPLRGLALVQGPPPPKERPSVRLPNMEILDCQRGVDEAAIVKFLGSLSERVA
jgi:hypothetical protein